MNDTALIVRAAAFAAERHRDQRRKDADASPYINHPLALADVLANEGGVTEAIVLAAALLHDTIEDTATTARELAEAFGQDVAGIVSRSPMTNRCQSRNASSARSSTRRT